MNFVFFLSNTVISVGDFTRLTQLYLSPSVINFEDALQDQKDEICLGSSIAPVLTEIYLDILDFAVLNYIESSKRILFLLPDTFRIYLFAVWTANPLQKSKQSFFSPAVNRYFCIDEPVDGNMQFLFPKLSGEPGQCWSYGRFSLKPLLSVSNKEGPN